MQIALCFLRLLIPEYVYFNKSYSSEPKPESMPKPFSNADLSRFVLPRKPLCRQTKDSLRIPRVRISTDAALSSGTCLTNIKEQHPCKVFSKMQKWKSTSETDRMHKSWSVKSTWPKPAGLPPPFLATTVFWERQEVRFYAKWLGWGQCLSRGGWEHGEIVPSITFPKGKHSTNSEEGFQGYNPFRNTPENRKSIQCLINLLQIDFT